MPEEGPSGFQGGRLWVKNEASRSKPPKLDLGHVKFELSVGRPYGTLKQRDSSSEETVSNRDTD